MNAPERLPGKRATPAKAVVPAYRRLRRAVLLTTAWACLGLSGCASFWDDVTSRDFEFRSLWVKPNPFVVLENSSDGDQRARALRALREPAQHGGTPEEQDFFVTTLCTAVQTERTSLCRQAAISSLRTFKDPRAAVALKEAYYKASAYPPETAAMLRCQILEALGETGGPVALDLLVKVVNEPPAAKATTVAEQQFILQERITASRALGKVKQPQATDALVQILKTEKDPGLREGAYEALELATGKRLPQDGKAWEEFVRNTKDPKDLYTDGPALPERVWEDVVNIGWWWK